MPLQNSSQISSQIAQVLVVEDNQTLSQAYKLILQKEGYKVRTAADGSEALELTSLIDFSTILLDMLMPVMSGVEFLEHFKPKEHPNTTIVILSNLNEEGEVHKAIKLGADRYILKSSISPQELIAQVSQSKDSKTQTAQGRQR
jgi:DNA-binding response OmpR family regulator